MEGWLKAPCMLPGIRCVYVCVCVCVCVCHTVTMTRSLPARRALHQTPTTAPMETDTRVTDMEARGMATARAGEYAPHCFCVLWSL